MACKTGSKCVRRGRSSLGEMADVAASIAAISSAVGSAEVKCRSIRSIDFTWTLQLIRGCDFLHANCCCLEFRRPGFWVNRIERKLVDGGLVRKMQCHERQAR